MFVSTRPPQSQPDQGGGPRSPVTLATLRRMAALGEPFACLACYDAMSAMWCARAGAHVLLAGDSAAQVALGLPRTIDMPVEVAIHMTAALRRGAPGVFVMADMPFLTYHTSEADALKNAGRFMIEGMADCVKLEADASFAPVVRAMTRAGIPVCGHIGLRPQSVGLDGGYKAKGRTTGEIERLVADAVALEEAGAVLLLIEAAPEEATRAVLEATKAPLIGIGAGEACHGQILVLNDLVGLTPDPPAFVNPTGALGAGLESAVREWVGRVASRSAGGRRYTMRKETSDANRANPDQGIGRNSGPSLEEVKPRAGSTERL